MEWSASSPFPPQSHCSEFLTRVVWHGSQEPYQSYPQLEGRFISEFGMQSLPHPRTLASFITQPGERYPQSRTMDHHNRAAGFERRLGAYILENFRLKSFALEEYAWQSQRMQSDALAVAYRGWRRRWGGPGRESVAGALVWQVSSKNDPPLLQNFCFCLGFGVVLIIVE
jgi:beta-mannosidase